ncbi:MAG: YdiU family protein, partial [Actinomycetia bacterium]|nr:YdiU family protein [Actinomycetes bacterium]
MDWHFDNTYARELAWLGAAMAPVPVEAPTPVFVNEPLAEQLGLDPEWLASPDGTAVLAGSVVPEGAEPIAMAYAGHQFGHFSPRLGDGRAHLLGEIVDRDGRRRDIALKGSGRTVFSRGGDGRAAIGPVLREVIISEAMHALGIPTTRALGAAETGEQVWRDRGPERGAVLARVAASHLRVGTLELVRTQGSLEQLRELVEYVRTRHYPDVAEGDVWALFDEIASRQAELIASWMSVGFIHGVMNTDNMALSGETIDYGPCAFLDHYDPDTVYSSIDTGGRYRYSAQPTIAQWNLARLAECLLPLDEAGPDAAVETATERVNGFAELCAAAFSRRMAAKLGLHPASPAAGGVERRSSDVGGIHPVCEGPVEEGEVATLINDLLEIMQRGSLDWTNTFRSLSAHLVTPDTPASHNLPNSSEMATGSESRGSSPDRSG